LKSGFISDDVALTGSAYRDNQELGSGPVRLGRGCVLVFNCRNQVSPLLRPRVSLSILHGW
jgi:hypothetical protein